jgi:riboflavin synthase
MFTGLIQSSGSVQALGPQQLLVNCRDHAIMNGLAIGDSVAVDGACLTVESITESGFVVTTSPETLSRTTLGQSVDTDWPVNLEPALRVGDRLGGHFVTGHVDGMGSVHSVEQSAESWVMAFTVSPNLGRYMVSKGSVAINGISLTIADCTEDGTQFTVAVIPVSFAQTNLQKLTPHAGVNIETDVLGKYVAKFLRSRSVGSAQSPASSLNEAWPTYDGLDEPSAITSDFLAEHGFV